MGPGGWHGAMVAELVAGVHAALAPTATAGTAEFRQTLTFSAAPGERNQLD